MLRVETKAELIFDRFCNLFHELWDLINERLAAKGLEQLFFDASVKCCKEDCTQPAYLKCKHCEMFLCVDHLEHLNVQLEDASGYLADIECKECIEKINLDFELARLDGCNISELSDFEESTEAAHIEANEQFL